MPVHQPAASQHAVPVPRYYAGSPSGRPSLSRERIRLIETIAMRKFQRELVKRGIRKSDLTAVTTQRPDFLRHESADYLIRPISLKAPGETTHRQCALRVCYRGTSTLAAVTKLIKIVTLKGSTD